MNQKSSFIRDFHTSFTPKSPSPRKPIDKDAYMRGHNDGWNAAVAFYKELGKI